MATSSSGRVVAVASVLVGWLGVQAVAAQAPRPPDVGKQRAEVAKLAWMVGSWEGEGWIQRGPERTEFRQSETITLRLDGLLMEIEGVGRSRSDPKQVHFHALGYLSWNEADGTLRLASWTSEGRTANATAEATEGGLVWGFDTGMGKVRYTITRRGERGWHEIGEFSADGAAWSQFFEMTLEKKS